MPNDNKSGPRRFASSIEISNLVRAHGITRDQARRLINKFGNNRAKLSEAARILKARFPAPREAALQSNGDGRKSSAAAGALRHSSALAPVGPQPTCRIEDFVGF
jgi:hypothetical protein